ncbi:hypothetical protein HK104_011149 [Borealophlyctis nickersoniae]|nr:hypothetical protein HK104_011149 [Borealophlyctis nickersoniae]
MPTEITASKKREHASVNGNAGGDVLNGPGGAGEKEGQSAAGAGKRRKIGAGSTRSQRTLLSYVKTEEKEGKVSENEEGNPPARGGKEEQKNGVVSDADTKKRASEFTAPAADAGGSPNFLRKTNASSPTHLLKHGLDLIIYKHFFPPTAATEFYNWCLTQLPWHRVSYMARGTKIVTPRWTTVFGKDFTSTSATSQLYHRPPVLIPPTLQSFLDQISTLTQKQFNFVLLNYYEKGSDSITYHSDDESFLGPNPTIASLSLGGTRDFLLKSKTGAHKEKLVLESGDLVVMQGTTQGKWLHSIPKRASAHPRVNITLRCAMNVAGTNNYYKYNVGDGDVYRFVDGKMVVTGKD